MRAPLLSMRELVESLGVCRATVYLWIKQGKLPKPVDRKALQRKPHSFNSNPINPKQRIRRWDSSEIDAAIKRMMRENDRWSSST